MAIPASNLSVAVLDSSAVVKIKGRANFTVSVSFKTLMQELSRRNCKRFVLDLTDCVIMDSTFLGVMARLSMDLEASRSNGNPKAITLLNPNAKVSELLDNLGVLTLFCVECGGAPCRDGQSSEMQVPVSVDATPTKEELSRNCLEAHKTLMAVNPANIPKFKEVTKFLEEDIKRTSKES